MDNPDEFQKPVARAALSLMEHYDSVVIMVTKQNGGLTNSTTWREGNFYASYGQAREWVDRMDESSRDKMRIKQQPDSGDQWK